MAWLLGFIGAIVGLTVGNIDEAFLGLCAGALFGWQAARISELRQRLNGLEAKGQTEQATLAAHTALKDPVPPGRAQPASPPPEASRSGWADERGYVEPPMSGRAVFALPDDEPPASSASAEAVSNAAAGATVASTTEFSSPAAAEHPERPDTPRQPPPIPRPAHARAATVDDRPDLADRIGSILRSWFFEGNVPVKLGVLLLFLGLAAAMRYAVEQGLISFPIELRLAAIAGLGVAGLIWGWRNRLLRPEFGLALQGGGIGVLLLTTFASFRLYGLLEPGAAFGLVVVLVLGAAVLAVLQNAVSLAVLGFIGGYLGPVLISTGSGNHVALFSYYAVLNAAVFAIAWIRPWRALNLVGFGFTFAVGTVWGARYYRPELFATVEPFLILFFLFYVAIAVLYALRGADSRRAVVDGTLVFGTPLLVFPLQAALLADDSMALAYSALAMAGLYASLAWWLLRSGRATLLGQSFAALALGFATLAVPLALSARWTSASWAVEGAALIWLGLRQQRQLPQFAGWALQLLALLAYFHGLIEQNWEPLPGEMLLLNGHALSVLLMALSAFFVSWLYEREGGGRISIWPPFLLGVFWWCIAGLRELVEMLPDIEPSLALTAFAALTAALAGLLRGVVWWPRLGWIVVASACLGLPLVLGTEVDIGALSTLTEHGYWLGWFAAVAFALFRLREPLQRGTSIAHVSMLATAALLYGLVMRDWASRSALDDGWLFVATLVPLLLLMLATWRLPRLAAWPLAHEFALYRSRWFAPAGLVLALAWVAALAERGGSSPLPFLPLLNPIELFQLCVLLVAVLLARRVGSRDGLAILAGVGLGFVTFAALRAVHHWHGAPWSAGILDDRVAQATLTVVWSLAGVAAWIIGSRRRHWGVWAAGAGLMGIVLLKLMLVDRRYFGDLAGIVSFMAVGGLLVLVGRIAPTPPRSGAANQATSSDAP
ncbi:MAG: DUF2339 domain-containing protein [Pseudomarimonas sp.]